MKRKEGLCGKNLAATKTRLLHYSIPIPYLLCPCLTSYHCRLLRTGSG